MGEAQLGCSLPGDDGLLSADWHSAQTLPVNAELERAGTPPPTNPALKLANLSRMTQG